MCEIYKVGFILVLLGAVGTYAFFLLHANRTRENYVFSSVVLLLFSAIYCVSVLQYKITGSALGIEKTIQKVESTRKEIAEVAENLIKMAAVIADGSSRWGGMPEVHKRKIEDYKHSIEEYLSPGLDKEIQETLRQLNLQIEQQNKK